MSEALKKAVETAQATGRIYIATADGSGAPHIASAAQIHAESEDVVTVREWFCPRTIENLDENRRIALVVYDPGHDFGYQLIGEVAEMREVAMMDGTSAKNLPPMPQEERELSIRVERILAFSQGPHTDRAL